MRRIRRRTRRTGFMTIAIVVLLICGIVSYKRIGLDVERKAYAKQVAELEKEIKDEQERTDELEEKKAYVQTKKYIEEVAREKLGLVYKDEIIFKSEK